MSATPETDCQTEATEQRAEAPLTVELEAATLHLERLANTAGSY